MLDAKEHSRILADFEHVCSTAGVQGRFLHESATKYCSDGEIEWVTKFWDHHSDGLPGLVLDKISRPDTRCQALAAALVRNYIDARVIPMNTLVDGASIGDTPSPTVLLIPNLFVVGLGKNMPAWRIQTVYDLLLDRAAHGKASVVYVEDLSQLKTVYGLPFWDFLGSFRVIHDSK